MCKPAKAPIPSATSGKKRSPRRCERQEVCSPVDFEIALSLRSQPIVDYVLKVEHEDGFAKSACWCQSWWCATGGKGCCTTAAPTC